ncbi:hypothetical protein, partial [uncultured Gemmiger sp.]|uniref:hypothetical protein n=1 Tax=uncultured Gemmiger sp. TaxID=1623490 RepID=UPI0025EB14D1
HGVKDLHDTLSSLKRVSLVSIIAAAAYGCKGLSCFYKQGAPNGRDFLPAGKALFRSNPDGLQGKATQYASKKAA